MNTAASYLRSLPNLNLRRMSWLVAAGVAIVLAFAPDRSEAQYFGQMCRNTIERNYNDCMDGADYWGEVQCRFLRYYYLEFCPLAV